MKQKRFLPKLILDKNSGKDKVLYIKIPEVKSKNIFDGLFLKCKKICFFSASVAKLSKEV